MAVSASFDPPLHILRQRSRFAGELVAVVMKQEELDAIEAGAVFQHGVPLGPGLRSQFGYNRLANRADASRHGARYQQIQPELADQNEIDHDAQQHEVQKEPQHNFQKEREARFHSSGLISM